MFWFHETENGSFCMVLLEWLYDWWFYGESQLFQSSFIVWDKWFCVHKIPDTTIVQFCHTASESKFDMENAGSIDYKVIGFNIMLHILLAVSST